MNRMEKKLKQRRRLDSGMGRIGSYFKCDRKVLTDVLFEPKA